MSYTALCSFARSSPVNLLASGFGSGGLRAESTLLLAAAAELTAKRVSGWESFADALEVLLGHGSVPPLLDTSAARVVGKAD